jgi:hypothetical protein
VGSVDVPSDAEEPGGVDRAGAGGADRRIPAARELPDPDERGRVYEAARAQVEASVAERAEPGRPHDVADQRSYWDQVPRFREMLADHMHRWPIRPTASIDRSADPPGPDGSSADTFRSRETAEAIGRVSEAEPSLSADVQAIERENEHDGWLEGFEYRLKGENRLKEKIAEGLATASPDATPEEVLRLIPDAIRYTFCLQQEKYTAGYYDIKERLESHGYEMYYSKNSWTDPEYKGVNTRWVTAGGQRFEIQFHTPESFHAKHHVTHTAYERIRDPAIGRRELRELHTFQRTVSAWIQVPDGAADIPDFRKEGF